MEERVLMKGLDNVIYKCFKDEEFFTLKDAYNQNEDKPLSNDLKELNLNMRCI